MDSYKSPSFFQVSDTGWFHTFTEFLNCTDIGWDDVWSRRRFRPCSFRSCAAKITVVRLRDNFWASHFGCKIQNWTVQEPELTAKMPGKCSFEDRWLNDSAYQEWVLTDKLDKHYAWCTACEMWLFCVCSLLLRWSLQNLILVLVSPCKVLIWL